MRFIPFIVTVFIFSYSCTESDERNTSDYHQNPPSADWDLIWADEFDGNELDLSKWNKLRWRPGWVNNELQAYTGRDINIFLETFSFAIQLLRFLKIYLASLIQTQISVRSISTSGLLKSFLIVFLIKSSFKIIQSNNF